MQKLLKSQNKEQNKLVLLLNKQKLAPIYETHMAIVSPHDVANRANARFPLESKHALTLLNSILDKHEKREILLYQTVYYYYFDDERQRKLIS